MTQRTKRKRQAGFTLFEVLMATVIASVAITSTWSVSNAVAAKHEMDAVPVEAARAAQEIYELAETLTGTPSGTTGVTSGADVVALDSLIGARFTPPIYADGTPNTALTGWTQVTDLTVYALKDLTTPTGEDASKGLGEHDGRLYKLTVKMLKSGVEVDSYCWWITP